MRLLTRLAVLAALAPLVLSTPGPVAAEPTTDACGPRPVKADGTMWSCTFVDGFSTSLDRSKWKAQTLFASGEADSVACYTASANNVRVGSGVLRLIVRKESTAVWCPYTSNYTRYTAGMVTTHGLWSQRYGRFEARIKNTATTYPGLHEAFWLWPDPRYSSINWPDSGEIDVAETYSAQPLLAIPFLHYTGLASDGTTPVPAVNTAWSCVAQRGVWNTYTLEWTPDSIQIYVNGTLCLTNIFADDAFDKRYLMALTQGLGVYSNTYDGRAPLPGTMSVDYVKVWQ